MADLPVASFMAPLPRQVLKWLQGLRLSQQTGKNVRREFSNGYLVAEILSLYEPQDFLLNAFGQETALDKKIVNWNMLKQIFAKRSMSMIPAKLIDATIHCKPGAAECLVQLVYSFLTNTSLSITLPEQCAFTDAEYQAALPAHARATMSMAIKNNMRSLELVSDPDMLSQARKTNQIISNHLDTRRMDRTTNPVRFDRLVTDDTGHTHRPQPTMEEEPAPPISHTALFATRRLEATKAATEVGVSTTMAGPVSVTTTKVERV